MIYKKLLTPIKNKSVTVQREGGGNYTGVLPVVVDNDQETISIQQDFINKVTTNENDITTLRNDLGDLGNQVNSNTNEIGKLKQIKGLDNLVQGDNVVLTPQGTNEVFINTSDNLNLSSITARNSVLEMKSETHFKDIPHFENGIIIDDTNINVSSQIQQLDKDLKIINNNGDILVVDKVGAFTLRALKQNQDKLIGDLSNAIIFKNEGEWNSATTYEKYDVVTYQGNSFWLDKETSLNETPTPNNSFWKPLSANVTDTYSKQEIDTKFQNTNTNVTSNRSDITQLQQQKQLLQQEINDISINHQLTIDPQQAPQWELNMVYSEIDPSDPTKGTVKIVPSSLKEYQLKQSLNSFKQSIDTINGTLKDITTSTEKILIKQLFYGAESKGSENEQGYSFYGYITDFGRIPLAKQVGERTFGNIFDVDYTQWEGVYYNGVKIPFGTNNSDLGINLSDNQFQATSNIQNITLYKEVVNDGVTKTYVDQQIAVLTGVTGTNSTAIGAIQTDLQETKTKAFNHTYNYGENMTNETVNGKPVYMFRINPNTNYFLPSDGFAGLILNVDEILEETIFCLSPFGDQDTNGKWVRLPAVKRGDAATQIVTDIIASNNRYGFHNKTVTGNRKFKGYVKYTKVS